MWWLVDGMKQINNRSLDRLRRTAPVTCVELARHRTLQPSESPEDESEHSEGEQEDTLTRHTGHQEEN